MISIATHGRLILTPSPCTYQICQWRDCIYCFVKHFIWESKHGTRSHPQYRRILPDRGFTQLSYSYLSFLCHLKLVIRSPQFSCYIIIFFYKIKVKSKFQELSD